MVHSPNPASPQRLQTATKCGHVLVHVAGRHLSGPTLYPLLTKRTRRPGPNTRRGKMPRPTPVSPANTKSEYKDDNSPEVKEMEPSATEQEFSQQVKNTCDPDYLRILETDSAYTVPQGKTENVQTYRRRIYDTIVFLMNTETKPPACASNGSGRIYK